MVLARKRLHGYQRPRARETRRKVTAFKTSAVSPSIPCRGGKVPTAVNCRLESNSKSYLLCSNRDSDSFSSGPESSRTRACTCAWKVGFNCATTQILRITTSTAEPRLSRPLPFLHFAPVPWEPGTSPVANMTRILCVAEKPSISKAVAGHLSGGHYQTVRPVFPSLLPRYTANGAVE